MYEYWEKYCEHLATVTSQRMEQANNAMITLVQTNDIFKLKTDEVRVLNESEEKVNGNKRNGTQDRQQAFGSLF